MRTEKPPAWQSWNSSRLFSSEDFQRSTEQQPLTVDGAVINHAVDQEAIAAFCGENNMSPDSLLKLAWGIVIGAYTGSEEACFLFEDGDSSESVVRCALDPSLLVCDILTSLEEVPFTAKDFHSNEHSEAPVFDTCFRINSRKTAAPNSVDEKHGMHQKVCIPCGI